MRTNVTQWGNSLAVRIPRVFADQINISKGSEVEMKLEQDKITLLKPACDLENMLSALKPEMLHDEVDTGGVTGKEKW